MRDDPRARWSISRRDETSFLTRFSQPPVRGCIPVTSSLRPEPSRTHYKLDIAHSPRRRYVVIWCGHSLGMIGHSLGM
jgi:hypothetical protein